MSAELPNPIGVRGSTPVLWGSIPFNGRAPSAVDVPTLIGWGDSAPHPFKLSPVERCALEWWGGWCEFDGGNIACLYNGSKNSDGSWNVGGSVLPRPYSWATDPTSTILTLRPGSYSPSRVAYGSIPFGSDSLPWTAAEIFAWGTSAPPGVRLTALESAALQQSGGWAHTAGPQGNGIINLSDPRYAKQSDGTWLNQNHPEDPIGIVTGVASEPKNGIAGIIDAIATDIAHDPFGAILLLIVLVSAGPALPAVLGALETVATVGAAAGAIQVATGNGSSILDTEGQAAKAIITHPAEIGRIAAGAELVIAGSLVGAKGIGSLLGGALIGSGVSEALNSPGSGPDAPNAPPIDRPRKFWWNAFRK